MSQTTIPDTRDGANAAPPSGTATGDGVHAAAHPAALDAGAGDAAARSAGNATPLIDLRQVSKRFGERPVGAAGRALQRLGLSKPPAITRAVDHVDLVVRPGEVVGLVGESGCGKSTLGRIAAGLLTPSGGEVLINGLRPADMTPDRKSTRLNSSH